MAQLRALDIAQKIRPANISDKNKISGEQQPRRVAAARVIKQRPVDMLGRMSRRVHRAQTNPTELDFIAIFDDVIGIVPSILRRPFPKNECAACHSIAL